MRRHSPEHRTRWTTGLLALLAAMGAWCASSIAAEQQQTSQQPGRQQSANYNFGSTAQQFDRERRQPNRNQRAELGVRMQPSETTGVLITAVEPGSAAAEAGLRAGDYVLAIDSEQIESPQELIRSIHWRGPGDKISLTVWRDGQRQQLTARLQAAATPAQQPARQQGRMTAQRPELIDETSTAWMGVWLEDSEQAGAQGAEVRSVFPSGPASRAGIRDGDVIVNIAGQPVQSSQEAADAIAKLTPGEETDVTILRNGERGTVNVTTGERDEFSGIVIVPPDVGESESDEFASPDESIPEYAMMLEQDRRFAEQHQRIEQLLLELLDEVHQLRDEMNERNQTNRQSGN